MRMASDMRRAKWPHRIYHVADLVNAATILTTGHVMSRQRAQNEGLLKMDSAAPSIISRSQYAHTWARFYFRPCTPTQANSEGIRPAKAVKMDAKRPVPIVFTFRASQMLTRAEATFTIGNYSSEGCASGNTGKFFEAMPFHDIYHDSALQPWTDRGRAIIFHRCAEILYDDAVDIDDLEEIVCRSGPERDSFLHRLGPDAKYWESKIRIVSRGERMFFTNWAFITDAALVGNEIRLTPNPVSEGPYEIRLRVWIPGVPDPIIDASETRPKLVAPIIATVPADVPRVKVRCQLEGQLAYEAILSRKALFL